jgi:hypothetical protein
MICVVAMIDVRSAALRLKGIKKGIEANLSEVVGLKRITSRTARDGVCDPKQQNAIRLKHVVAL